MKVTRCDRCKKHFEEEIMMITYKHYQNEEVEYQIDICPTCFNEFIKFMKMEDQAK